MARLYNDSAVTYNASDISYVGVKVHAVTATGSGTGGSSSTENRIVPRTATGSGTGTSLNAIVHKQLRTATGSGGATTGDTATGLHTQIRTATGSGAGGSSATGLHKHLRAATGSGVGASSATGLHKHLRTATGTGDGTSTSTELRIVLRTATGSGAGTQTAVGAKVSKREGTGTGTGADIAGTWIKSFIFRPPAEADYPLSSYYDQTPAGRLFSYMEPGKRRLNVYKLTDGTYTSVDPRDDNLVSKIYFGGHNNFVTAEEKTDLVAAGYEVT